MTSRFDQPPWWQRWRPLVAGYDAILMAVVLLLAAAGMLAMYSVGHDQGTRFVDHGRNMLLAALVMLLVGQVSPQRLMALAVPLYAVGVALLVATALFGETRKGATRWLHVGVVIQPSEILKLAMPLMLAWWFQRREAQLRLLDVVVAGALLLVPVALVARQPDLGTAILVLSSGLFVMFFAGLSWRLIAPVALLAALAIGALVIGADEWCDPERIWPLVRDYQKQRVCTLLDPTNDPLGKGFHILQGMIAIGSGGLGGKGFMSGTQTHLEFIPERTTDFIFAAFAEEFGLVGVSALVLAFGVLIARGLVIAAQAPTLFARLLAGAISLALFTYAFVNMAWSVASCRWSVCLCRSSVMAARQWSHWVARWAC